MGVFLKKLGPAMIDLFDGPVVTMPEPATKPPAGGVGRYICATICGSYHLSHNMGPFDYNKELTFYWGNKKKKMMKNQTWFVLVTTQKFAFYFVTSC
jgi:hypothetical protein